MKAINNHIYALKVTADSLSKGKLLLFFLPGLIIGIIYLSATSYTSGLSESAESLNEIWGIGGVLAGTVQGTLGFIDIILNEIFKFTILVLLSPFNSILSEKFDNQLTGNKFDGGFIRILNDVLRAILIVILALVFELVFLLVWWIFSWIFPDIIDSLVHFVISSFFLGFAFYDYSLERYGIGTGSSWGFAFRNMLHMVITGGIFSLIFMIPVAGIIVAPVLLTMIATAAYLKLRGDKLPPETV